MSRIGKKPIKIPAGVIITIAGKQVTVTGPRGEMRRSLNPDMVISLADDTLAVTRPSDSKNHRAMHGLTRTLLANMVEGVTNGFQKYLDIVGVGFRAEQKGTELSLRLGFSHTVTVTPLPGITLTAETPNRIKVSGINRETVGEMAAEIRAIRPPDAYKGKGIRYAGERVRQKAGKAGKAIGKK
ncbi:MAG: 50S ribosomal protein L6 [Dehalococcoidia bacterium]|jgi:large subunit ribosomal protein L6|nr:MAG: 50S ribosomal protein L6 [Dehalococcoidia bacterium]